MRARHLCYLLMLCFPPLPAWSAEAMRVVDTRTLTLPRPPAAAAYALELNLYAFAGTRWQPGDILAVVPQSASLLAACGVALTQSVLRVLEAPRRFHFYSTAASRELLRKFPFAKPAVVFVEDTLNRPAYDAETIGMANAATRPELANTIWVAYGARDLSRALAHELVHLLSNSGEHAEEARNLMRPETSSENTQLTPAQCAQLRSQGMAHGLLERRRE